MGSLHPWLVPNGHVNVFYFPRQWMSSVKFSSSGKPGVILIWQPFMLHWICLLELGFTIVRFKIASIKRHQAIGKLAHFPGSGHMRSVFFHCRQSMKWLNNKLKQQYWSLKWRREKKPGNNNQPKENRQLWHFGRVPFNKTCKNIFNGAFICYNLMLASPATSACHM